MIYPAMKENRTPQAGESARAPTHGQAHPSNRILVVDDDISIRELSAQVLTAFGFQVETAEDGVAGWEALHASSYDLLITDHNMPKVTGVELVKKLRSARMTLPVVLVSGAMPTEELSRNPLLQLAATLLKPFSPDELLGIVEKVLRAAEGAPSHAVYFPVTPRAAPRAQI
jgi:DNA-binding response OmpR family regulator